MPPETFENGVSNVKELLDAFRNLDKSKRTLLSEVMKVVKLVIVLPATNAVSERSCSALKRIKTYLRSTTSTNRLNHLMMLHVHKDKTDRLDIEDICSDFISIKGTNNVHYLGVSIETHDFRVLL